MASPLQGHPAAPSDHAPYSFTITSDEVAPRMPRASLARASQESLQSLLIASLEAFQNLSGGRPEALKNPLRILSQGTPELLESLSRPPSELLMSF
eukprot:5404692-Pyramimonas_sp.AAC.1